MSKRGRPAKLGARYPGGKLKPQGDPVSPIILQRLFRDATKLGIDQRLASQVGRLWCIREFSALHAAVAFRIGAIYARYEFHKGLRRSTRSPSYEQGFGQSGAAEELLGPTALEDREQRIRDATHSFQDLQKLIPPRYRAVIEQLCVEDCTISSLVLGDVREIFEAIASVWGMRRQQNSGQQPGGVRGHIPLHFNEHAKSTRSAADGDPLAIGRPAPNIDRIFWIETIRKLRPDLSDDELKLAYDMTQARKERERFRRTKTPKIVRLQTREAG